MDTARYGDSRRKRPLFLPNPLRAESSDKRLQNAAQEKAYQILLKWAELESSGKLQKQKETEVEGEFLNQVFGEALGYTLFSEGQEQWNLKPKYNVNGGEADAAIGLFGSARNQKPVAVIEFKGPTVNVDRDKFDGRTAVQQCWDYLYAVPDCPWGIVCNYVSFRLYHRNQTQRAYELFTLQEIRQREKFLQFYYLFEKGGLLPTAMSQIPRAEMLLERSSNRQREVGSQLYQDYHDNRLRLIQYLAGEACNKSIDNAIRIAQKLIDRIIFVAFCEDRGLLPPESIKEAWDKVAPFDRVTNPKWQNFLDLFRSIDEGNERRGICPYNGGLFRKDDEVDDLGLDDDWTNFFKAIGDYDFRYEVNVDVLGHLFEKSINDIEKIRLGGLFESSVEDEILPKMIKSAERKKGGIYYTPPEFTEFITNHTVAKIADEKLSVIAQQYKIDKDDPDLSKHDGKVVQYTADAVEALRQIKIIDPACGSGAFLIQAYEVLEEKYLDVLEILAFHDLKKAEKLKDQTPDFILHDNLFGVDLSPEAVEITQLALWLRSAQKGKSLADLSHNIVCGNSLVSDIEVDQLAMDWKKTFKHVLSRDERGFDCVIGNPPWERIKLQEREFFDALVPSIATAVSAATRRKLINKLRKAKPELHQRYEEAKTSAEKTLAHIRKAGNFPLTAKGDINTYQLFAELARNLVGPNGIVGLLVPSGISTDKTTKDFFANLVDSQTLVGLYDFENKAPVFPDVHRSYKFCVLLFGGTERRSSSVDFVFFSHTMEDLKDRERHIVLKSEDFKLLNPNTCTCPVFRTARDAEITKEIYRRVPVFVDNTRKEGGNPWGVKFIRMFDQTNDAELFESASRLKAAKFKRTGAIWKKGKKTALPLYEAKMVQMFDHRAASIVVKDENWMRQGQTNPTTMVQHQNPEFAPEPRWWILENEVHRVLKKTYPSGFIAFKDITSPTNQRTMIASALPWSGVTNHLPVILTTQSPRLRMCLLANLNSFALDYVARQKIGGVTLNFFIVEQFPILPPDFYSQRCPWNKQQKLEKWISDRALRLTCNSNDMMPLSAITKFKPSVQKWNPPKRLDLQAQLDAAFFLLYGVKLADIKYILSTFSGVCKNHKYMFDGSNTMERIIFHYKTLSQKAKVR